MSDDMIIITSSGMDQISTGFPDKHQGLFTYYLAKALSKKKFTLSELYTYLKPAVENEAKKMNIEQSPSMFPPESTLLKELSLFPQ